MVDPSTPILVGCGEITDLTTPSDAGRSPFDLIAAASRLALLDALCETPTDPACAILESIDTVAMVRLFADSSHRFTTKLGSSTNPPASIARRLGIAAPRLIYTSSGGNMPQYLVNQFAEAIARREIRSALIAGGEALRTQLALERAGKAAVWHEDPGGQSEFVGDPRRAFSEIEERHGARAAIVMYPLFENAIRGVRKRSVAEHIQAIATLMARFAQVASDNPLAVRRDGLSSNVLATVNEQNRWIGFPYPRLLNANVFIDQAAALVMTSAGEARRLGIPETKWVYLHGCADVNDHWYVTERHNLHSSPAIRSGSRAALEMAGKTLDDLRFLDLYSCFPSAVEIGCQEIGLAEDDPRGLTITGGLPFFGGPGNNYVTHAIGHMMRVLRAAPDSFGLVTANGNYITKHSFGVYSTSPVHGRWRRERPAVLQTALDALPKAAVVEHATGAAIIETYTIMHGKCGPEGGVILGRMKEGGARFIAQTSSDPRVLSDLQAREGLGRPGSVRDDGGRNLFTAGD